MEKWSGREGHYLYSVTQKVHDEAGRGTHIPDLLSSSLSPGDQRRRSSGACGHIFGLSHAHKCVSRGDHCTGLSPSCTLIFSSGDKGVLDLDRNQKGRPDCWGPERGERTPKSGSVETAGKSLTLRSLERRSSNPHDDRVELQYKCFQISVARKQMTC